MVKTADFPRSVWAVVQSLWIRLYLWGHLPTSPVSQVDRENSPGFRKPSSRWMGQKVFVPPSFFQTEKNLSEHLLNDSRNRFYSAWTVRFQPSGLARVL